MDQVIKTPPHQTSAPPLTPPCFKRESFIADPCSVALNFIFIADLVEIDTFVQRNQSMFSVAECIVYESMSETNVAE
jgi:hypothetical protein